MMLSAFPTVTSFPTDYEKYAVTMQTVKSVEVFQRRTDHLDWDLAISFYIPKQYTVDERILNSVKPALALANTGKFNPRSRSATAVELCLFTFSRMSPDNDYGVASQQTVRDRASKVLFGDAGTEFCVGRLAEYYPRKGAVPPCPVTEKEARDALRRCGLDVQTGLILSSYPLIPEEGQEGISVNPHSSNGFPVRGKWSTPGAPELAGRLAATVIRDLQRPSYRGVRGVRTWLDEKAGTEPWLVAFEGKCKADYYKAEKVETLKMRFYNCVPRQLLLVMQMATQPYERHSRSILADASSHSGIGMSLVRGGAEALVDRLDEQLRGESRKAYVHVGDDSLCLVWTPAGIVELDLDCSSFDLTQHGDVTLEVHEVIRRQLARFNEVSADLWFNLMRERLVVTFQSVVRKWKHGGASGMPLQSKVNDMLMDVLINRIFGAVSAFDWQNKELVGQVVEREGKRMGFSVRLENYAFVPGVNTFRDFLARKPVLFVGYYFHNSDGAIDICADITRTLSQIPYPSLKWMKEGQEMEVLEAMRLGSIVMNLGIPPPGLAAAVNAARLWTTNLVERVLRRYGDQTDEKLRWAVSESPFGEGTVPSLSGLLRALAREPEVLFRGVLPNVSDFLSPQESGRLLQSWADLVEEEAEAGPSVRGSVVPKAFVLNGKKLPVGKVSLRNDGRPPPTVYWAPDKAPQTPFVGAGRLPREGLSRRDARQDRAQLVRAGYDLNDEDERTYYTGRYDEDLQ